MLRLGRHATKDNTSDKLLCIVGVFLSDFNITKTIWGVFFQDFEYFRANNPDFPLGLVTCTDIYNMPPFSEICSDDNFTCAGIRQDESGILFF